MHFKPDVGVRSYERGSPALRNPGPARDTPAHSGTESKPFALIGR